MTKEEALLIMEIKAMTLEELLRHQRFDPIGSKYHVGVVGDYFQTTLSAIRKSVTNEAWVQASKSVGW